MRSYRGAKYDRVFYSPVAVVSPPVAVVLGGRTLSVICRPEHVGRRVVAAVSVAVVRLSAAPTDDCPPERCCLRLPSDASGPPITQPSFPHCIQPCTQ